MRSVSSNITSYYLKQGNRPRVFINIADSDKYWGSKAGYTTYTNRLLSSISLSQSIKPEGGMPTVSGLNFSVGRAGEAFAFHESADIDASTAGYYSAANSVYIDARDAVSGTQHTGSCTVGQTYNVGSNLYTVYRTYLSFSIPVGITTCDDAFLRFDGSSDSSDTDFYIRVVGGTSYASFNGHETSGVYTLTQWEEDFNSSSYVAGDNLIHLNSAGLSAITSASSGILYLVLLSSIDASNTAPTGDEYVTFTNTPTLEIIYNSANPDNRRVAVKVGFEDDTGTLPSSGDLLTVWSGVADTFSLTPESATIECRHDNFRYNIKVPQKIITTDDYADCPEENVGKAYPLVYGEFAETGLHKTGVADFNGITPDSTKVSLHNFSYPDCFKCYVVEKDGTQIKALLTHNSDNLFVNSAPFFLYNSTTSSYNIFPGDVTLYRTTGVKTLRYIECADDTAYIPDTLCEGYFKGIHTVIPYDHATSGTVTNPTYSYDTDSDNTYTEITVDGSYIDYYFTDISSHTDGTVAFIVFATFQDSMDPTKLRIKLLVDERDEPTDSHNWQLTAVNITPWTADGQQQFAFFNVDANFNRTPVSLSQTSLRIEHDDAAGGTARIYDVCALVAYDNENVTELYSVGQGRDFGTWIDDGGRSNSYDEDDLIDNPALIIESLARTEAGISSTYIDTSAFDTASSTLSSWVFAFELLDRKPLFTYSGASTTLIDDLAFMCKSWVRFDDTGKLTITVIDLTDGFAVSGTDTPSDLDIVEYSGSPSSDAVTRHPIINNSISIEQQPLDDVANDFVLNYRLNYATNSYEESLYLTNGLGTSGNCDSNINNSYLTGSQTLTGLKTLAADCYTTIRTTNTYEYDAWAIRDETTATMLLQHLIEWKTQRRYIVRFETGVNFIKHEVGDFINIRTPDIYELFGEYTAYTKKWMITDITFNASSFTHTVEAIEV